MSDEAKASRDDAPAESEAPEKVSSKSVAAGKPAGAEGSRAAPPAPRARTRALLALAAGFLVASVAHAAVLWPCGLAGLALWSLALEGAPARRALWVSGLFGLAGCLGLWHWLPETVVQFTGLPRAAGYVAYVGFCALSSLPFALAGLLAALTRPVLGHAVALGAAAWLMEASGPHIFPWQPAASLIEMPFVPQAASLVGVSGLGAVLLALCTVGNRALLHRAHPATARAWSLPSPSRAQRRGALAVSAGLVLYGALYGAYVRGALAAAPRVSVALVQPAIPPLVRWDPASAGAILQRLHELTDEAHREPVQLVVWSEGAFPFHLPMRPGLDGTQAPPVYPPRNAPGQAPILFGAVAEDPPADRMYNGAYLREPDATLSEPVAKRVLVPFGEHVPLFGEVPWVRRTFARAYGLWPGTARTELRTRSGLRLGVLNCFEDMIAPLAADLSASDLLVNITNDSWFGDTLGPDEHLMLARWRSIEQRRDMVRAVTRGVTSHVDATGAVVRRLDTPEAGVLRVRPAIVRGFTPARWVIPAAPWALAALLLGALVLRVVRAPRRSAHGLTSAPAREGAGFAALLPGRARTGRAPLHQATEQVSRAATSSGVHELPSIRESEH